MSHRSQRKSPRAWAGGLLLVLTACSSTDDAERARVTDGEMVAVNDAGIPVDTVIRLERTMCYGPCPSYAVTIDAAGTVHFDGRAFVEHVGEARHEMGTAEVARILSSFEAAEFHGFEDEYLEENCTELWTDYPILTFELTSAGRAKKVEYDLGCMGVENGDALIRLADIIDNLAGIQRWIGSGKPREDETDAGP